MGSNGDIVRKAVEKVLGRKNSSGRSFYADHAVAILSTLEK
jgi:hypothetical protein